MLTIATTPDWLFFTVAGVGILVVLALILAVIFAWPEPVLDHENLEDR